MTETQHRIPAAIGIILAVVAGLMISLQGRVNGALGAAMHDSLGAAFISFGSGLVIIFLYTLCFPKGRRGMGQILPSLRERRFPRYFILAGMIGGFLVLSQSLVVGSIGIALFTVAVVLGQSISGLIVDHIGYSPAGKQRITVLRVVSVIIIIGAVIWAVSPHFAGTGSISTWLLPVLMPLAAGFLISFQQSMNATQGMNYGSPLPATFMNFLAGSVALGIIWAVKLLVAGPPSTIPSQWYLYVGGAAGCIFIGLGAWLIKGIGVLLTGLGMIAGQILGSLALDIMFPSGGTVVTLATWLGTLLTLAAMVLATLPWKKAELEA